MKRGKHPLNLAAFRIGHRDRELWELAADREEINLSEFARRAVLERARRVLLSTAASEMEHQP